MTSPSDQHPAPDPTSDRSSRPSSGVAGDLTRLADGLGRINAPLGEAGRWTAAGLLAVMMAVVLMQIVLRYVFSSPLSWTEEVSKALMVWSAFLVAPWAYRNGQNVTIDLFADALGARVRAALHGVLTLAVLWACGLFFLEALALVERGMDTRASTLPIRNAVFYAITPVSFAALIAVGVELLLRHAGQALSPPTSPAAPPPSGHPSGNPSGPEAGPAAT